MDEFISRDVFDERMKSLDAENDRQNHRITKIEDTINTLNELTISVREIAVSLTNMQRELERQGRRLDTIEAEPADKWKGLTKTVITGIVSALVAYFLAKGGIL